MAALALLFGGDKESNRDDAIHDDPPCAFLGPMLSRIAVPTSTITGILGYAQVSALVTSEELENKKAFPLFAKTRPSIAHHGLPFVEYVYQQLNVKHLCVV